MRFLIVAALATGSTLAAPYGKDAPAAYDKVGATEVSVGKRLSVGAPVVLGDVAVFAVLDREATKRPQTDFVPMANAIASGQLHLAEVPGGAVGQLTAHNRGKQPVLVMAGDLLRGGNQDRVIAEDLVIPPTAEPVRVSVNCVEKERWESEGGFAYAGRAEWALRQVVQTRQSQESTWAAVAQLNSGASAAPAASYLNRYDATTRDVQRDLDLRLADKRVVGVIIARSGSFEGAELYGHPALFQRQRSEVLRSHIPVDPTVDTAAPSTEDAASYLRGVLASNDGGGTYALRSATGGVIHVSSYLP